MRKRIIALSCALLLAPYLQPALAYSPATAKDYLSAHNVNPWTVMGLAAAGASSIPADHLKGVQGSAAINFAAPILAITSLGQNPRTFGATDYVEKLKSFHTNGQIGDAAALNDDIFSILALVSAGVPAADAAIADAKAFLLSHQNSDGGWGFMLSSGSDTNTTASAILALLAANAPPSDAHIQNAISYLESAQNSDGGFPYDPKSSFGTTSDTSSTAWVLWAENALGANWKKNGHQAADYLTTTQTAAGYFEFQSGSGEDSFSPVTTAYAVMALAGKKLPLKIVQPYPNAFDFRIEGSAEQVCSGKTAGPTALDIVKNAAQQCGFAYHITETGFGPYLDQIGSDQATGLTGWIYLVNNASGAVGAGDYVLKEGDGVLWYFGDFNWKPLQLSLSTADAAKNSPVTVTVESFAEGVFSPAPGATIKFGAQSATTNSDGRIAITPPEGYYKIFAEKNGFVRSASALLKIGSPPEASVGLNATIDAGNVLGETDAPTTDTIAFTVEPRSIDFGALEPGKSAEKNATITNTGTAAIRLEGVITGDDLFRGSISVNGKPWQQFKTDLAKNASQTETLKLAVPAEYAGRGSKSGQITFWAQTQ